MDATHESGVSPCLRDAVLDVLLEDHRAIRIVVKILQSALNDIAAFGKSPDFALLSAVLYYLDDYPERVHHPKEDKYLFPAVRRRTNRLEATIQRLHKDHERSAQMLVQLERELVHLQGGAPQALQRITASATRYAELLEVHMETEERLLSDVRNELTEDDWRDLAQGLGAQRDPLGGDTTSQEFRLLRLRILSALPTKMRLDPSSARTMRGLNHD